MRPAIPLRPTLRPWLASGLALLVACACAGTEPAGDRHQTPGPPEAASERPYSLELEAWQLGDRILVVARGQNRTGGFDTALVPGGEGAALRLRNVPPKEAATQMITPFERSAWIPAEEPRGSLTVRVPAGDEEVVVRQVERAGD